MPTGVWSKLARDWIGKAKVVFEATRVQESFLGTGRRGLPSLQPNISLPLPPPTPETSTSGGKFLLP